MKNLILFILTAFISYNITLVSLPQNRTHINDNLLPVEPLLSLKEQSGVMYSSDLLIRYTYDDVRCMTANIYFEGRNQENDGQLLIGQTVINRYTNIRFKNTICGVITDGRYKDGKIVRNKCHYSWFCDGISDRPDLSLKRESIAWDTAQRFAKALLSGEIIYNSKATHYHTKEVKPTWIYSAKMIYLNTIQNHLAYQEI